MFGTVSVREGQWSIEAEPHVVLRLKRVFGKLSGKSRHRHTLSDTIENARELAWFLDRYPMTIEPAHSLYLARRSAEHREQANYIDDLLSGHVAPQAFALAEPAREYQRVAAQLLLTRGNLLLADDVGLGKTVSAICTLCDTRTLPALIVTLTHLPTQWEREIHRFAPRLRVHIVTSGKVYDIAKKGTRKRSLEQSYLPNVDPALPDVIIINYHKLRGWAEALAGKIKLIVFDECQELRKDDSQKAGAANLVASRASYRLGLSATPIYNYGIEFFNVLSVLSPHMLGTRTEFAEEWCGGSGDDKAQIKDPKSFGTYVRESGLMLRRTRSDVARELPAFQSVTHHIDADLEALESVTASCAELARIILAQGETRRGAKMSAAEEFSNALRHATGVAKAPYVAEFVRLLVESGEQVVLFGWHRDVYSIWLDKLKDLDPAMYTGSESAKEKDEARARFLDRQSKVLIMSLRSGAGLDGLQHVCRTAVFGELDWSPGILEQCAGRVHRDGQADPVVAYYLVSEEGADPVMADILGLKRSQIELVRDPNAELAERLSVDGNHVKKLAEAFLKKAGKAA